MHLDLYTYNGKQNIAKKEEGFTSKFSGDVITYNYVNPLEMAFILGELYDCNYAKYSYNGKTYYAHVIINTEADGLYKYSCTVDPLTTCWYGGCFHTNMLIERKTDGTSLDKDTIAGFKESVDVASHEFTNSRAKDYYILIQSTMCSWDSFPVCGDMGTYAGGLNFVYWGTKESTSVGTNEFLTYPFQTITYLLKPGQWEYFIEDFGRRKDYIQNKIATCILRMAVIDAATVGTITQMENKGIIKEFRGACFENATSLYRDNASAIYFQYTAVEAEIGDYDPIKTGETAIRVGPKNNTSGWTNPTNPAYYFTHCATDADVYNSVYVHNWGTPKVISPFNDWQFNFRFKYAPSTPMIAVRDIGLTQWDSIGYKVVFNPGDFTVTYVPSVNGTFYKRYSIAGQVGTTFPLPFDSSITNWTQVYAAWVNLAATGIVSGITNIAGRVAAAREYDTQMDLVQGKARALEKKYADNQYLYFQKLDQKKTNVTPSQIHTDLVGLKKQYENEKLAIDLAIPRAPEGNMSPFITANVATSAISAVAGVANAYANAAFQEKTGGISTTGQSGGNEFWANHWGDIVFVYYTEIEPNKTTFNNLYGKPHRQFEIMDSIESGYILPNQCNPLQKGYPIDVIAAGASLANAGFYVSI